MIKEVDNLFLLIKITILVYYLKSYTFYITFNTFLHRYRLKCLKIFKNIFQQFKHIPVFTLYKEHLKYLIL